MCAACGSRQYRILLTLSPPRRGGSADRLPTPTQGQLNNSSIYVPALVHRGPSSSSPLSSVYLDKLWYRVPARLMTSREKKWRPNEFDERHEKHARRRDATHGASTADHPAYDRYRCLPRGSATRGPCENWLVGDAFGTRIGLPFALVLDEKHNHQCGIVSHWNLYHLVGSYCGYM